MIKNLTEKLPYWDIFDGVMLLQDSRVEAGVEIDLQPQLFMANLGQITTALQAVMRSVPEGGRIRFRTDVRPDDDAMISAYSDLTEDGPGRILTEARRDAFEAQRHAGMLSKRQSTVSVVLGNARSEKNPIPKSERGLLLAEAHEVTQMVQNYLEQGGFTCRNLITQDVFDRCFYYWNPGLSLCPTAQYTPTSQRYGRKVLEDKRYEGLRPPTLRAQITKSGIKNTKLSYLQVGDSFVRMLALYTEPEKVFQTLGNLLLGASGSFSVIVDMLHEPHARKLRAIKTINQINFGRISGTSQGSGYVDGDADSSMQRGRDLTAYLEQTGDHMFRVSVTIVLNGDDPATLKKRSVAMLGHLSSVPGSPWRILEKGLFKHFKAVAPFGGGYYEESVSLVEGQAVHMIPVNGPARLSERPVALFRTRHKTLVALNPFDERTANSHAIFLGGSGGGKTFTAQYVLTETLRTSNTQAAIIDRGLSWARTVSYFGGPTVPIEPGGGVSINPFDLPEGVTQPSDDKIGFLTTLIKAMTAGSDDDGDQDIILLNAIAQRYKASTTEVKSNGDYIKVLEPFTLSNFNETLLSLNAIGGRPVSDTEKKLAEQISRRLLKWCGDTPLGRFIDRPTTLPRENAKTILYETSAFERMPGLDAVGTMLIQEAIWERANESGQKLIQVTDEAWAILGNPHARKFQMEFIRRGRQKGVAVWLLTHSLRELQSADLTGIIQSLSHVYLFKVKDEDEELQRIFELNPNAFGEYKSIRQRKGVYNEFFYFTDYGSGKEGEILRLEPSRFDYYMYTNAPGDLARIKTLTEQLGSESAAVRELARSEQ